MKLLNFGLTDGYPTMTSPMVLNPQD